ncbi:MAG: hypothetical protein A7315_06230 [Candidatus Altiarchaeales archaeon WOR_SM1_79]|nr:MAG: hypothetical protein A7315_06230 [Candidatus Altiarchaeales archaeon WOR_SM1_79]
MRVIFGLTFLGFASYTDFKTRRVKDEVWILMGLFGGVFLALQMFLEKKGWEYYLIFFPVSVLFISLFFNLESIFKKEKKTYYFKVFALYMVGIIPVIYQFYALSSETYFYQLLTIPILIIFFYILYQFDILHGGADAKAMMAIAILVPFYPHFFFFPLMGFSSERVAMAMEVFFPFAFLVLMNSVLFIVWVFIGFIIYNTSKGDFGFPEMLLGYRMDIQNVENKFVWPMEKIVKGERVMVLFPKKNDDESLDKLKKLGIKRIWVTPKIPFIVFLTVGFMISAIIGNGFVFIIGLFA